jgi:cell division protein FtsI/penicillin-binding protein 2
MELMRQRIRFFWVGLLVVLAFGALAYRLVDLQVIRYEEFIERANRSHALQITLKGHRGDIRDARGEILAHSLPARAICADPGLIGSHYPAMARVLSRLLQTNETVLLAALRPQVRTNALGQPVLDGKGRPVTNRFVRLRRKVLDEDWQRISAALAQETFGLGPDCRNAIRDLRRSIHTDRDEDELRVYPNGSLAGPVLGFTDAEGNGLEGLEAFLNEQLKGVDGYIKSGRTLPGRELRRFREVQMAAQHGLNIYLTLDARLQLIVEEELSATVALFQASGGCVVVVQPQTGRILAMATCPGYDPNRPPLEPGDAARRRNWGVSHTFEPGSTFKLVAATAVLNEGALSLDDRVDCGENGQWQQTFGRERVTLRDDHPLKERYLPVERVIAESSNIGTFQLALRVGRQQYYEYLRRFGFDAKSGIRLPLEEDGVLRRVGNWSMTDFSRITIGYSVSVTPLQLGMAMSALAADGRLMRPQIIDRIVAPDGKVLVQPMPEVLREVCTRRTAAEVRRALREVVEDGTGSLVRMERYSVAGKTGTARIAPYTERRYHASFAGFLPGETAELCIVVVVEDPNPRIGYYGGRVAGPAFKAIAQRAADYLGIPPDLPGPEETLNETRSALTANRRY